MSAPLTGLAVGHITCDRYGDDTEIGGSSYYAAKTWQALGVQTTLATSFNAGFDTGAHLDGIAVCNDAGESTTVFRNTYPEGKDRVMKVAGIARPVTPQGTGTPSGPYDLCFLAPVIGELEIARWVDDVDAARVGVGLQGFLKQPGAQPDAEGLRQVAHRPFEPGAELLKKIDAVFLSVEDLALGSRGGLLNHLLAHVPFVLLTNGERGATLFHEGQPAQIGIYPTNAIDPTGAGDVIATGFLWALQTGFTPADAARFGAAAASVVVEQQAGRSLPRIGEAHHRWSKIA